MANAKPRRRGTPAWDVGYNKQLQASHRLSRSSQGIPKRKTEGLGGFEKGHLAVQSKMTRKDKPKRPKAGK